MKKSFVILLCMALCLLLGACGEQTEVLVISQINLLDRNDEPIAEEDGIYYTRGCTVEVLFSGPVDKITFYELPEGEERRLAKRVGETLVGDANRALYKWTPEIGFVGYMWIVLNDDDSSWEAGAYRKVCTDIYPGFAYYSCKQEGKQYELMLFQPVEKGETGIWAVQSYRDEQGEHIPEFKPTPYVTTQEYAYQLIQDASNLQGGHSEQTSPEGSAALFLSEQFGFVPEQYEVRLQRDNNY